MYIETKNKISKREGRPKGKNLPWSCFYLAVFAETTTVQDRGRAFQENWLSKTFSCNLVRNTQAGKTIKCTVDTPYR